MNSGSAFVSVLRASDGTHAMTPTVSSNSYGIAFDGAFMWVTNYTANTVTKVQAPTLAQLFLPQVWR